jgi:Mg2+-importing ATPase
MASQLPLPLDGSPISRTPAFWSLSTAQAMQQLDSTPRGLSSAEASRRLARYGPNRLARRTQSGAVAMLLHQFTSPIILLLLFSAGLSFFLGERTDALIIFGILLISGLLSFWQEYSAANAIARLLVVIQTTASVLRDGTAVDIPLEEVVPGDCVFLHAGDMIPGDCQMLDSKDLFVNEAALTGETYPVEKAAGVLPPDTPLNKCANALFLGTHVVSGTATALVVHTGATTQFGQISVRLQLRPPQTEFERGIRRFGNLLVEVTLVLVLGIFAVNVYFQRPVIDSFLFALALAVGLTPQLLPAIISIVLARGAQRMARAQVIVKQLSSMENFGSMNVLCSDKTGTLTEGMVQLHAAQGIGGTDSERVLRAAYLNAVYETGFTNPIDAAIRAVRTFDLANVPKLDEIPYDFLRKRLSVLVEQDGAPLMITKGALANVLDVCATVELPNGTVTDITDVRDQIQQRFVALSEQGFRVFGIACRTVTTHRISRTDETDMTFLGFLTFFDPPKANIVATLRDLRQLGIQLKIITGDNRAVAAHVSQQVGITQPGILSGADLHRMSDEALRAQVNNVAIFAEIEPNQKERIILALRKTGNVVGYMGDGINDASALHTADVGISVANAVDVAKEAAHIVLLKQDLGVLAQGVREGRMTFANTLKYVFIATSANFGNMFSMAGASLFLSFLPLLPKQILVMNMITDIPEMTMATDSVDPELVERPLRWNMAFIRSFMLTFGLVSSIFDYITFGVLVFVLHAGVNEFRTGWFVESVISAALIVLVVRTRRLFFRSRPSRYLLGATIMIVGLTLLLPYSPLSELLGFTPLPTTFLLILAGIILLYVGTAELAKNVFYRHVQL